MVEGEDIAHREALADCHQRRIRDADRMIGVARFDLEGSHEIGVLNRLPVKRTVHQLLQKRSLRFRAEAREDQIVDLGKHEVCRNEVGGAWTRAT